MSPFWLARPHGLSPSNNPLSHQEDFLLLRPVAPLGLLPLQGAPFEFAARLGNPGVFPPWRHHPRPRPPEWTRPERDGHRGVRLKSELFRSCVQSTQMLLPATASMGSSVPPACRPKPACPWVTRAASHALLLGLRRHRRCPAPNVVCFRDHLDSKWRLLHLSSTLPRQSRLQKHWSHSPPGWRSENRDLPRRRFTCTDQSP